MNPRLRFKQADGTDYPDWEEKKLGDICNIYDGTHQTPNYTKTGIKFVSVENINDLYSSQKFISEKDFDKNYKIYPQKGDILMTRIGDIGTPALVSKDEKIAFYVSLALFKPNNIINSKFFVQVLQSNFVKQEFWIRTLHTAFPKKINKKDIGICKLFFPCLEEQEKIGSFLSDIDEVILASDQEVKKLQELKKGAMQKIFSQEVRFKMSDGTDYPDWEEKKLGDITSFIRNGFSYKEGNNKNFPVSRIETISDRIVNYNRIGYAEFVPEDYLLKTGDILFSNINSLEHIGKTAFYESNSKLYHGMNLICLRPSDINNKFLFYLLNTETVRKINHIHAKRAVSQCSISVNDIRSYKLQIPCLEEQQKIGDFLSDFDEAISLAKQELEKWKLLKKGLLQQMFT